MRHRTTLSTTCCSRLSLVIWHWYFTTQWVYSDACGMWSDLYNFTRYLLQILKVKFWKLQVRVRCLLFWHRVQCIDATFQVCSCEGIARSLPAAVVTWSPSRSSHVPDCRARLHSDCSTHYSLRRSARKTQRPAAYLLEGDFLQCTF